MSLGRNPKNKKQEREDKLNECVNRAVPQELDVVDKGDHLKVVSCGSRDLAAWWMGALKAAYPQDHYSDSGENLKMHPAMGVTLKLNRNDGTLKIKGKKHMDWFKDNFEQVIESGNKSLGKISEMSRTINRYLKLDDGYTLPEVLDHLPVAGAIKHGPSYCYRLWKGLLDQWISTSGTIYVVSPLFDAKRVADILLLLVKHKSSQSKVLIHTMSRCDGDTKFPKVYKHARHMLKTLKNPNTGKKLIVDERLNQALKRVDTKFGGFHLKLIACVRNETTELLLTSANFHNWHFHYDHSDMVVYFRLPTDDFRESYLEPLGLVAHQFGSQPLLPRDVSVSSNASESGSIHSPSNTSAQAFPALDGSNSSNNQQQSQQQNGVAGDVSNSSSGTATPTTTPRSNRSSNRPTPSQTPKIQQRVTLAPDNQSTDTLTNQNENETTTVVETSEPVTQNHVDAVDGSVVAPTQVTKTTTVEKGPDSHITKTTTTYETTTTFRTNSLPRNTPSPRPQVEAPPPPPPPPMNFNESDDSVDITIQQYNAAPRVAGVQYQRETTPQSHSNTSTLSRHSEGTPSFHDESHPAYSQQSTLPTRDRQEPPRAQSYHGHSEPTSRGYRHDVSRSYNEAHARNVSPVFTEVRTAHTKRTNPTSPVGGHHTPIQYHYPQQTHHNQSYERTTDQTSLLQRASPVSPFYTELQQVKTRSGPRDQFSHSFEKRMSSLEESGTAQYNEEPEAESPNPSPSVHPIYSEVKRNHKKKSSQNMEDDTPPPMPPVFVETRTKNTYIKGTSPHSTSNDVGIQRERSRSPPEVPETYKVIKARQAQQQYEEVTPVKRAEEQQSPPPHAPPPPPPESEPPEPPQPYDPQLRNEFSPKERAALHYTPTFDEYEKHKQALKDAERNQTRVVPPYTLPLSIEREEKIMPKQESQKKVVSSPKGPNFSPTYEQSPPPPQEPAKSPTLDYTEVPIFPEVKPTALNVTSSPKRRVPSEKDETTPASKPTNEVTTPPAPPPILHEETYQKKPVRSLHPSVTTTTTSKDIRRSGSRETTPTGKRDSRERDSTSPANTKMVYAYSEMTPAEAQSLYANMTKPESAKDGPVPVQEVKTTRHRIEVTRVTHIDTTNVRPYDGPNISNIRFADSEPQPTESHI